VHEAVKTIPSFRQQISELFSINEHFTSLSMVFIEKTENPGIQLNGTDDVHLLYTSGTTNHYEKS
jgi:long-chain acyl-CoA synthetase